MQNSNSIPAAEFFNEKPAFMSEHEWAFHPANPYALAQWIERLLKEVTGLSWRTGWSWCGQEHFAARIGKSLRTIKAALKRLVELGLLLCRRPNRRRTNQYRLGPGIDAVAAPPPSPQVALREFKKPPGSAAKKEVAESPPRPKKEDGTANNRYISVIGDVLKKFGIGRVKKPDLDAWRTNQVGSSGREKANQKVGSEDLKTLARDLLRDGPTQPWEWDIIRAAGLETGSV